MPTDDISWLVLAIAAVAALGLILLVARRRSSGRLIGGASSPASTQVETPRRATAPAPDAVTTLALAGDASLHGVRGYDTLTDVERAQMPWLVGQMTSEATKQTGAEIAKDPMARQRLGEAIVAALIELREVEETEINLPYLVADASGPKHYRRQLTRIEAEAAEC
jgi:hypothetical protein